MLENHQRLELYRIFARLFSYPEPLLLNDLNHEVATLQQLLQDEEYLLPADISLHELEVAYTRLFISHFGGVPAPPYGSVYLEESRQLMGQTSLCALRAYEDEGLNHTQSIEPPDFIATELEFLYYLISRETEASAQQNQTLSQAFRQKQIDFCHTLLQPWIGKFCQRILDVADGHPLYRWSATMLLSFCRHEETFYGVPPEPL